MFFIVFLCIYPLNKFEYTYLMCEGWSWIPRWSHEDVEQAAAGELNYHQWHPMTSWIREAHAAPSKGICFGMMNDIEWHWRIQSVSKMFQRCCMMRGHFRGSQMWNIPGDLRSGLVLTVKAEHCSRQVPREARALQVTWREKWGWVKTLVPSEPQNSW